MRQHRFVACLQFAFVSVLGIISNQPRIRDGMHRVEQLHRRPEKWNVDAFPQPSLRFQLHIALHQQNVALFEETLIRISTPDDPKYGQHMSRQAIKAMLRPKEEAIRAVLNWVRSGGAKDVVEDSDWIHANVTVAQAENLINARYLWYRNKVTGVRRMRALSYDVPNSLRDYVIMIQPTTLFEQMHSEIRGRRRVPRNQQRPPTGTGTLTNRFDFTSCNVTNINQPGFFPNLTPDCIRALYNMGDPPAKSGIPSNASFGVVGYLAEYAKFDQLSQFLAGFATYAVGTSFAVVSVNGGINPQDDPFDDDLEANLDTQYSIAIGYPVPVTYYTVGNASTVEGDTQVEDLDFLFFMMNQPDDALPQTLSTSYGQDEIGTSFQWATVACNMFAQLGARGVSILYSSGDSGPGEDCQTLDGQLRFDPQFPATCPFVTAVGATNGVNPEQAAVYSSGGFSDIFARPSYQDAAVTAYLEILGTQWNGLFNASGRAFPDVSAQGTFAVVFDDDEETLVYGTSVSCPVFAGIIALVSSDLMDQGLPPLGFLNPWLYSTARPTLTDIVVGGSTGCTANDTGTAPEDPDPVIPFASWNATPGWDPVTGLGTPDLQKLLDLSPATATTTVSNYIVK